MARERIDGGKQGLRGYQGLFLALTLVVMMIIILSTKDIATAIIVIGLITNFLIISSQLTLMGDRHVKITEKTSKDLATSVMVNPDPSLLVSLRPGAEAFTTATTAPPGAGPPAFPVVPDTHMSTQYPGAIDFGDGDEAPALGHVDWDAADRDNVPEGNPFDLDRIQSPQAAAPCIDDDAIAIYDGDELNTYHARARNDPERVWAGIYRRKALVDQYVREELDEQENSQWWGNHEV